MYLARQSQSLLVVTTIGIALVLSQISSLADDKISNTALQEIRSLVAEKDARSPLHRKLDSQFVYQLKQNSRQLLSSGLPGLQPAIEFEPDGRVLVDIDARVSDDLLTQIKAVGGTIVSSVPRFHSIRASVPFDQLETLAGSTNVNFIKRAMKAQVFTGSVDSAGDTTHGAISARTNFGATGAGVKVGVLSDSVDYLDDSQASGDLPTNVVVLPGQAGSGHGEGTAMLEVIHDLAPDAQLYFAAGLSSEASFAQNILDLRSNGCDIIVDDISYFDESPFQDGIVAQAVNTVTADGALYFSSAGNDGNLNATTSTTWEGDFVDGGAIDPGSPIGELGEGGSRIHSFGGVTYNRALTAYNFSLTTVVTLFWADPLGAATNDYDLFVLDPFGTHVLYASGNYQNGTQDPFEACYCEANSRIVVVKYTGDGRFLHLQLMANGVARLNQSTTGNVFGHCTATNAFCVAAINATAPFSNPFGASYPEGPFPDQFSAGAGNFVEWFSSDGPRHIFFNSDGSPMTPGDFSSTGGVFRQKPDLTAADGVTTTVPGSFQPLFYGTSAAAPHAAAIAALLKSYNHSLTPEQVRAALLSTALDIEDPGADRDSGAGIVMANPALQYVQNLLVFSILSFSYTNNATTNSPATSSAATLTWNSLTNQMYQVEYTTDLFNTNWIYVGSPVTATNTSMTLTDQYTNDLQRFYRVMIVP